MIGTTKKPLAEILDVLTRYKRIGVIGCDGCAKACATGGSAQVGEMAETLKGRGKKVVFSVTPERTCYLGKSRDAISPHMNELKASEALLVLGCGGAVQIIRQLTEEDGITIPVKSGLDSVGHMDTLVMGELATEQCGECGQCVLNDTGGICPVTKCAKSLLNGPCGGAENGRCEVDRNRDCAWIAIYNRLKALGELDHLSSYIGPKDHSKAARPRTLYIKKGVVE